jgi:Tfp pilus assembly protein PilP
MRLAKTSRVLLLGLSAVVVTGLAAQEHPNIKPSVVRGQLQRAGRPAARKQAPAAPRPAGTPAEKPKKEAPAARRDPFAALLSKARPGNGEPANLPPGKAGLIINTLRVQGIVQGPNGMIAVVSNPDQRVYFLRDGDKLYDGSVEKITLGAVSFHEVGKDAFGKRIEREVTKRLYQSSGEQP